MKYGFLGLGIMGKAMASNLIKDGHELVVWNRTASACDPLVELGAEATDDIAEVLAKADVIFAMLADPEAALAVGTGPGGVAENIKPGQSYVEMSTIDAQTSRVIDQAVEAKGARYLEAPVSGSKKPAEDGTLVFLAAGDESLYEEVSMALDVMGKKRIFLGECGQGARMKLIVNMIMGGMMTALSEGLETARRSDLNPDELLEVLGAGAIANPMFAGKGPNMLKDEFTVAFPLKHIAKDLRLALELCHEQDVAAPTAQAASDQFARAEDAQWGDLDFSAVFRALSR